MRGAFKNNSKLLIYLKLCNPVEVVNESYIHRSDQIIFPLKCDPDNVCFVLWSAAYLICGDECGGVVGWRGE